MPTDSMSDIGTTKIVVSSDDLPRGYREGFERFKQDYPDRFPDDSQIATFIRHHACSPLGSTRSRSGYIVGWCAGLLARSLFIALPTHQRTERGEP